MANMFGALNRFIAHLDSSPHPQSTASQPNAPSSSSNNNNNNNNPNAYGFQILRNTSALNLPLEPWFDFIIGINNHAIDNGDANLLATEIRNCAGSTISLGVYSVKGQQIREIYAPIPADYASSAAGGLGLGLQWAPLSAADDVWHILDVMPNSPADVAGLLPYGDYVIGSPEGTMEGESALGDLVEAFMNAPLRLYVYNHEYDVVRMVTITPARNWGGDGALGCVLGYGALHRVPAPLTEPSHGPGETLFESGEDSARAGDAGIEGEKGGEDFLVPADIQPAAVAASPAPPQAGNDAPPKATPPPPSGRARKQRAHHTAAPAAGLDDYFAEGEQKSREADKGSTPKPNASLPPPPKGKT